MRKIAVRGMITLAVFVALCMFFSGTVRTITTPKVRLTKPKKGRMEERIELAFKPAFPEVDKVTPPLADDMTLTVVRVNTREGYTVEEGDVLYEAKVTNYDQLYKQYQEAYDAAAEQLLSLESKNRGLRITQRDQAYANAYYALRDARHEAVTRELEMDAQLGREKLERTEEGYPEGASDELIKMIDDWREAVEARKEAQAVMDKAARYTVDETVWTYITERREQEQKRDEAERSLRQLVSYNDAAKAIAAPHSGYVAELNVKEGETYDGSQALYSITAVDVLPTLRADISEVERTVSEGMTVSLNPDSFEPIETQVVATGTDTEGKKYADVALTEQLIKNKGSVYAMMQEDTTMTLIYRAKESSTLLPSSAVGGSGSDRYVFVAQRSEGRLGGSVLKVHKMDVTVQGESNGTTSVKEDLIFYTLAYGEDRPISDNDTVMEYLN